MKKAWAKVIGVGLVGVALGCSGPDSGETEITGRQDEIRNGAPIPFPRSDAQVAITAGSLAFGTGTLLSQEWVVTAGHVVDDRRTNIPNISVRLGNLSDSGAQVRNAVAVYHHPAYQIGLFSGPTNPSVVDVALVRVSPPFSGAFTRIISSASNSTLLNFTTVCNGYGQTVEGDSSTLGTLTTGLMSIAAVNPNFARVVPSLAVNMILPGDSGGPCFDVAGGVLGVMSTNRGGPPVTEGFIVPADAFRSWANGIIANCGGLTPGSSSFCSAECPCVYGNGDCEDGQCSTGNVCSVDVGPGFKMTRTTDVCAPEACAADTLGSDTFCLPADTETQCPCGYGGGDCDNSPAGQCMDGLVCATDYGPAFKMSPITDVCVTAACANRTVGSSTFCTPGCPCGHGGGDCDGPADCMPGLVCATDFGPAFNMTSATDVCVPSGCASKTLYSSTFCTPDCPCGIGGGDCDGDEDCLPGLECVDNIGAQFGASAATDICMRP